MHLVHPLATPMHTSSYNNAIDARTWEYSPLVVVKYPLRRKASLPPLP